jgi:DNA-binding CsgD family transcriptional regulator
MPAPEHPSGAFAALTAKEREILHLLAAGHTVKSIASRLGKSEPSINERLRDARRKTGVSSSRELARLLAAQKNCDEKIDLATDSSLPDPAVPRPSKGRILWKGTVIMLIALSVASVALMLGAADSSQKPSAPQEQHATAADTIPLIGKWSLDTSRIPEAERPRSVTMEFRLSPDRKWQTTVDIVAPDGSGQHAESTAALDGVPVPISGNMPSIETVALRQPAPNTLVMTLGKGGTPVSTRVYAVAKDGQSMTETIIWAGNSIPPLETTYFKRVD